MKTIIFIAIFGICSGCVQNKPIPVEETVSPVVFERYYTTLDKSIKTSAATASKFFDSAIAVAGAISKPPPAPAENEGLVVKGDKNQYDIALPNSESLLPLYEQQTMQVQALTASMSDAVKAARIDVAAPPGFVNPEEMAKYPVSLDLRNNLPSLLDELPDHVERK